MFREMRRNKQQISREECIEILKRGTSGVLAVLGDEEYPYTVPLSYAYQDGIIYFHGAIEGHKMDAMKKHEKVSFCVINRDQVIPEDYTTLFCSVIVFGKVSIIKDEEKKREAAKIVGERYRPGFEADCEKEINRLFSGLCVFEIQVEHMTGKQSLGLLEQR